MKQLCKRRKRRKTIFCNKGGTERQQSGNVMETYSKYLKYTTSGGLRNKELYKISNGLYVSQLPELSVADYIICKERNRNKLHNVNGGVSVCSKCCGLVSVVKEIQEKGMVKVSETLKKYFSGNAYSSEEAVRKFMSLPVVIFELGDASKRTQTLYMIERHAGVDYIKYVELLRSASGGIDTSCSSNSINKEKLKALCELASSEKDRKLIKYAMCGDFSNKTAKKYGLSDWNRQKDEIESSVERSKEIREAVIELACLEEKTVLRSYGIEIESDNESIISRESGESCDWNSEKESDSEGESEGGQTNSEREMADCRLDKHSEEYNFDPDRLQKESTPLISDVPSFDNLVFILRQNNLNWFSFVEEIKSTIRSLSPEAMSQLLIDFAHYLPVSDLSNDEEREVEDSRQSFLLYCRGKMCALIQNQTIQMSG